MSHDKEQIITKKDLQAIIEESNRHRRWDNAYKVAKIIATPLIITLVSMYVTWRINMQQAENTERMTKIQIESAHIIAEANIENSAKISESDQRIKRLDHIKDIFTNFLTDDEKRMKGDKKLSKQEVDAAKLQIISLEVYKEDALLFLLNIKEHYLNTRNQLPAKGKEDQIQNYDDLINQADKSIKNILLNSQHDLSNRLFMDCGDSQVCINFEKEFKVIEYRNTLKKMIPVNLSITKIDNVNAGNPFLVNFEGLEFNEINLRKQKYKNFDFSNCSFITANLYSSDFSSCTLNSSLFVDVDLEEATFSGSNLSGAIFCGSNLQKANFMDSKLRDVVFVRPILNKRHANEAIKRFCEQSTCCELEGAQFSLGSLLWTKTPPFDVFNRDKNESVDEVLRKEWLDLYINLLMHHRQSIALMADAAKEGDIKEEEKLNTLLENTDAGSEQKLLQLLQNAAEKNKILTTPDTPKKYSSLSN